MAELNYSQIRFEHLQNKSKAIIRDSFNYNHTAIKRA